MGVRAREISILLGVLMALLTIFALQTGASGQASGSEIAGEPVDVSGESEYVAGELIVTYEESATETAEDAAVEDVNGEVEDELGAVEGEAELVELPTVQDDPAGEARKEKLADAREELLDQPGVQSVDYNYVRKLTAEAGEPVNDEFYYEQYGLDKPNFPAAWIKADGDGVQVGVVDSGIAQDHEDFRYNGTTPEQDFPGLSEVLIQRDFVNRDPVADDENGHGTHVAGTIGAATNNVSGVAATAPGADLLIAKAFNAEGESTDVLVADAITWSWQQGAEVINLSLGGGGSSAYLQDRVNRAYAAGAVLVASSGNTGDSTKIYPAAYGNVMAVAATNSLDQRASFSTYGGWVDIAAAGDGIISTYPEGDPPYLFLDGTSMAAPHVSGLAALLMSQDADRTNTETRSLIISTAKDIAPFGRDSFTGSGRINANKALNKGS